jgi:hypothetical protein
MKPPKTQYARSGDISIAYQVVGDGPLVSQFTLGAQESWGEGIMLTLLAPSALTDDHEREWWGSFERTAISPRVLRPMSAANTELDIRAILPTIRVLTARGTCCRSRELGTWRRASPAPG